MSSSFSPERWAYEITHVLNAVLGAEHFPINVTAVAQEYSAHKFPNDPIARIVGDNLPGFDGALYKAPEGKKGWAIFYNNGIRSTGRINFTLGHEFGHYLLHRLVYPDGIRCGEQDFVQWDSTYGQIEHQANVFAANLLMPLDDFRRQIAPSSKIDLDLISHCSLSCFAHRGNSPLARLYRKAGRFSGIARRIYLVGAFEHACSKDWSILSYVSGPYRYTRRVARSTTIDRRKPCNEGSRGRCLVSGAVDGNDCPFRAI